ncbi:DUF444 family protein [Bacteroidetes/Chlorobi group bacterium Naka2016]|jgi:uncharacterized sporulation protein YeaH/YhbH (DUF444 family)|nr:MAG: DUF444 family protein [Bacteroidetes/Chlorobi group bacterium Naka2016]
MPEKSQDIKENDLNFENFVDIVNRIRARLNDLFKLDDVHIFLKPESRLYSPKVELQTLEELLERDKQREKDGFPRRIRIGKLMRPDGSGKPKIVIVPTTVEPKFYHDTRVTTEEEPQTGGTGEEEEGEVIGEAPLQPQEGEGEGYGPGQGEGGAHEISEEAFDLGKILTEKFELPNIKPKGKKPSFTKFQYDLTDIHRGFGQILDKKATIKSIIKTNLLLGRVDETLSTDPSEFLIIPTDHVYRIVSKEKDYEAQAVVFFIRDYSGSMHGKPTEVVTRQHIFIYSWLMYQYQNNVTTRFILHDTNAREVPDFMTYIRLQVAGGTRVAPAFQLVDKIIEEERLYLENNIYVFYGGDGDDWDEDGRETIEAVRKMFPFVNRIGITIARNPWGGATKSTVEKYFERSSILKERPDLIKIDGFDAETYDENRLIQGIKILVS